MYQTLFLPPTQICLKMPDSLTLLLGTWIVHVQDLCLIPEVPFYMDGSGGLLEFAKQRLRENGHMVIVVAEGAGQELMAESMGSLDKLSDASGNRLLLDVGLWLCQHLKDHFVKEFKEPLNLKYIGKLMPYLCFGNFLGSCRK
jgi:6-phosphofructokinase